MKKRAAICISGHLREYQSGYENICKRIIEPNAVVFDFDFFIHTWDVMEWRRASDISVKPNTPLYSDISNVLELYRPAAISIESDIEWDTSDMVKYVQPGDIKKGTRGEHIMGMYYKILQCDGLRQYFQKTHGIMYDVVFRCRTDIAFNKDIRLPTQLSQDSIFIAKKYIQSTNWRSDVFAFGADLAMQYYSRMFEHIKEYAGRYKTFRPEPLLFYYLRDAQFLVQELEQDWYVVR